MKQIQSALFLVCTLLLMSGILSAQNSDIQPGLYNEGIIVLENGSELNALIQVKKWQINPDNITIKRSENAKLESLELDEICSFTIPGKLKFIRQTVQIDTSRNPDLSTSEQKEPAYSTRTVLLKVLVEGKASLYSYRAKDLHQHFYFKSPKTEITYLEYKVYLATPGRYSYNNEYQHQLHSRLKCAKNRTNKVPKVEYDFDELIDFVVSYNTCTGSDIIKYDINEPGDIVNFYLSAGRNSTAFTIYYSRLSASPNLKLDYGATTHLSLNGGVEWMIPVKSIDLSILTGMSYQTLKASTPFKAEPYIDRMTRFETKYLNLSAELRNYFRVYHNHALFLSGTIGFSFNSTSRFNFDFERYKAEFKNTPFYQISAGYMWNELLFGKLSYTPPYDTFTGSDVLESELSSLTFSIGISL